MTSLMNTFNALDLRKKIILAVAVLATVALVLMVARGATRPTMAMLYGGLAPKEAGQVIEALNQLGVKNEVRGAKIFVPITEIDRVRLDLAAQDLPAQGQAGYELLDGLSGFGTTSEMFEAAYWRAKEGELVRTIQAVPGVVKARVHIGASARRPFARAAQKSTAAVTVHTAGGPLSNANALAIRYLVALAVADLDPTQVAVIDARHGMVLRPGEDRAAPFADENAERRAERLKEQLERLLAVRVGEGNVRINVAIETTTQSETVSEKIIDPESRVTVTSETEEVTEDLANGGGAVTVASNLPDGDVAPQGDEGRSKREQAKESITYNYSQTQRSRVTEAGAVKRIGIAVLVNEVQETAPDGTTTSRPRSAQELAAIEDLVKSASAFDAERGDVVTVESMSFAKEPELGTAAEISLIEQVIANNMVELLQGIMLALVAVALGMFVVRPILVSAAAERQAALEADEAQEQEAIEALEGAEAEERAALDGAVDPVAGAALPSPGEAVGAGALATVDPSELAAVGADPTQALEDMGPIDEATGKPLVEILREAVSDKSDESVALLKRWLHAPLEQTEEGAGS